MKYEVAYVSVSGNSEKLMHGIADTLPHRKTFVTDLSHEEITGKADVYLIGFGVNKGAIPLRVMEILEELHGKTLLFFITCGMDPVDEYREMIEKKLLPFLPDDCDYKGVFICPGKFSEDVLRSARMLLEDEPDNPYAQKILEDSELSREHPNQSDVEHAYRFIREHLGM